MAPSDWLQDCLSGRGKKEPKVGGRALCAGVACFEQYLVRCGPKSFLCQGLRGLPMLHIHVPLACVRMHVVSHFHSAFHRLLLKRRSEYSGSSYRVGPNWVPRRRIYHDSSATGLKGRPVLPIFLLRVVYCPTSKISAKL